MIRPLLVLMFLAASGAQGNAPIDSFLRQYAQTRRFTAGLPAKPVLTPDGDAVLFLRSGPRSAMQSLFVTDLKSGETRELASAESLLGGGGRAPTAEERAQLERQRITARGITRFELSEDGKRVAVSLGGKLFLVDRRTESIRELNVDGGPLDPTFSPDGRSLAYVSNRELWLVDLEKNVRRPLTSGAGESITRGLADFVAQEELDRFSGMWWSPDSLQLVYQETDEREVERFFIADPFHPERPADAYRYPRAGTANARVRLGVVSATGGATTWLEWDHERFPYVGWVTWPGKGLLSIVVSSRRQTEKQLLAADPATGKTRVLVSEQDERWLNPVPDLPLWLQNGSGFFWLTERNGGPEIELRGADGELRGSWVKPPQGLDSLVGYDEERGQLWFTGGANPTESRLYSMKKGRSPKELGLPGPGSISAFLARHGGALLVTRATVEGVQAPVVYRPDGKKVLELPSVAEKPPYGARAELRRVGPGEGLWTLLVRPHGAAPGRKLPVIVSMYGGPGHQMVTTGPHWIEQWIADQGFLVVSIDNRGTPRRGSEWERALFKDFAGPTLEDQAAGLRALAAELPEEMDLSRVGAFGWSFGGYLSALAVMKQPELFKAAVAGAPVVDWRDYDTAYTERYLGLPQEDPAAYERSSLLSYAGKLQRPLLLIHGTADDNVYYFHSLKLADALFRAGRPYELMTLPGLTHLAIATADSAVVERLLARVVRHFRENL